MTYQRRATDALGIVQKRRKWSPPERKYRLAYRRRPIATTLSTIAAVLATSVIAYGSTQVTSIFAGTPYAGAGWACSAPVTWTTDLASIPADKRPAILNEMRRAFASWGRASGVTFTYAGESPVVYSDADTTVKTVADINRNIAVTFLPDAKSTFLTKQVVGFASPSQVWTDTRQITGGYVGFQSEYVSTATSRQRQALFTHEIGHALGLADSDDRTNVMYRIVDKRTTLAPGDISGVKALLQGC